LGASAALAMAFLCRPSALIATVALSAIVLLGRRRGVAWFVTGTIVAHILAMTFLLFVYGHPLGAYGLLNLNESMWVPSHLPTGLLGTLISPSRGLLPYFPWLILAPFAHFKSKARDRATWWVSATTVVAYVLLAAGYSKWWGGYALGPRLPTEAFPFATLLLTPFFVEWNRYLRLRLALMVAFLPSALTQVVSIYNPRAFAWNEAADPDRRPWILWSAANSQFAATWLPQWQVRLPPYRPRDTAAGIAPYLEPIDLTTVANSRYDRDPFTPGDRYSLARYPRLDPHVVGGPVFRFGPRGSLNTATTCGGSSRLTIPLKLGKIESLHLVLAASGVNGEEGDATTASLEVEHSESEPETLPIRLNREVFAYWPYLRSHTPGPRRVYAGKGSDPDVLVSTELTLARPDIPVVSLTLQSDSRQSGCVALLALTAQPAGEQPRE